MKIVSINIGQPELISYKGYQGTTGINKKSVTAPVKVVHHHIEGDHVLDKKHHGGEFKAIYSYAAEHYPYWHEIMGDALDLPYGSFGENLTTEGLDESTVHIGDWFQIGASVVLEAVQPRFPCRTLGAKFRDMNVVQQFLESGRYGIYFRVIEPGEIMPGDPIECIRYHPEHILLSEISRLHLHDKTDREGLERILKVDALPPEWQKRFGNQLQKA